MRIAVSTSKGGLGDSVCPVFGRCPTFTVVEVEGETMGEVKVVQNPGSVAGGGAGIAAAQEIVNLGASSLITGNCGPNATGVLARAGVKVYASSGTVEQSIKDFLAGSLKSIEGPTVPGHFGMHGGAGKILGGRRGGMR
ncbi:MAG: NifB/NifX family molybdenum-iron cluster-binding protein [Candidatus Micrarchaeota archaeon]